MRHSKLRSAPASHELPSFLWQDVNLKVPGSVMAALGSVFTASKFCIGIQCLLLPKMFGYSEKRRSTALEIFSQFASVHLRTL
jgi:hypothetical protein